MFGKRSRQMLLAWYIGVSLLGATPAFALVKDTDTDGLTDQAEANLYLTDPDNPDTDGDAVLDSDEILQNTSPLSPTSHPAQAVIHEIQSGASIAWFIGRASGILSFILLTIVVVNGLLMTTRLVFRLLPPPLNYEIHHFLSWMAVIAIIGHFISFTFDEYFHLTFFEGLVPFTVVRDFTSHLGFHLGWTVSLGTIAFYGILALVISSELKNRFLSIKKWRALHYLSFVTYLLFLAHGIFVGTDSDTWWMIWLYGLSALLVCGLIGLRISLAVRKKNPLSA